MYAGTVVKRIFDTVTVRVYFRNFASITDTVSVGILLVFVGVIRTVVACIADTVTVAVKLVRVVVVRAVVLAVINIIAVIAVDIRNVASADAWFCFVEIIGAEVDNIAVGLFVVFVRFGFRRFIVLIRFRILGLIVLDIAVFSNDRIGKILFVRFFSNVVPFRNNSLGTCCFVAACRKRNNKE